MAVLFSILVSIVIAGWLWFYIARPILEDFGIIKGDGDVKDYQEPAPHVMSRSEDGAPRLSPSSVQTDGVQTDRQPDAKAPGRAELLTFYALLRAAGISREKARPVLKGVGLPLDNNLWAQADPKNEDDTLITPIAGRPTRRSYYTDDPDLRYNPPPN